MPESLQKPDQLMERKKYSLVDTTSPSNVPVVVGR
jgi:hypothetical protein